MNTYTKPIWIGFTNYGDAELHRLHDWYETAEYVDNTNPFKNKAVKPFVEELTIIGDCDNANHFSIYMDSSVCYNYHNPPVSILIKELVTGVDVPFEDLVLATNYAGIADFEHAQKYRELLTALRTFISDNDLRVIQITDYDPNGESTELLLTSVYCIYAVKNIITE